jgi:hypothetical protein
VTPSARAITLADLETHDRSARGPAEGERRFLCPEPACAGHQRTPGHRSLSVNMRTGAWHCHRCKASGRLADVGASGPVLSPRQRARQSLRRFTTLTPATHMGDRIALAPAAPVAARSDPSAASAPVLPAPYVPPADGVIRLPHTPGALYLRNRGIPDDLANRCARYAASWFGRPAVLFPVRNLSGRLVGANGRYIDPTADPKARSSGSIADGLFATPGALEAQLPVITEAPIDALSLAAAGMPAVALCGTALRPWLANHYARRMVLLAFDADKAGQTASEQWSSELRRAGAHARSMVPQAGAKDWNALLQTVGAEALGTRLAEIVRELAGNVAPPAPSAPLRVCAHGRCRATPTIGYYCDEHDPFGPATGE